MEDVGCSETNFRLSLTQSHLIMLHSPQAPARTGNCVKFLSTEVPVEGISFVGYTGVEGGRPRLWNLQNLCPLPPYWYSFLSTDQDHDLALFNLLDKIS